MKKVLVLLLFGFIFNMTYATPPFHQDKDNPEQLVVVSNDISVDSVFVANFTKESDFDFYKDNFISIGSLESASDTTIIINDGTRFMIINYFQMNERIHNSLLDPTRCYKQNSIHFIKTLKALRKIPDTINEVYGSSGGLPLS